MAITMQYRAMQFVKDYFVKFLNMVFLANEKGSLQFTDGTVEIKFSRTPQAVRTFSWTSEILPAILVGVSGGKFVERTFAKNLLDNEAVADDGQYYYHGGDIDLTVDFAIRARTVPECDNITDITCIFLSRGETKDFFLRHDIKLPEPPSISGESALEHLIDHPIYEVRLSMPVHCGWVEKTPLEERLIEIYTDVDLWVDVN